MRLKLSVMAPAAVVLGLSSVYAARTWVERQVAQRMEAVQVRAPAQATASFGAIVVAAEPLAFGTVLTRAQLREIPWPKDNQLQGSFSSIDQMLDGKTKRVALSAMQSNEPVLSSKITGPGQRANLAAVIDADHKAITVRVDDVIGVAGFLQPGDRVDVLLSRKLPQGDAEADVVLQNLKVLGVDQTVDDRAGKPAVARSVTLEVETDQAQRLVVAQNIGSLTLVLRPIGAAQSQPHRRVSASDLLQTRRIANEAVVAPRVTVGVIRNLARQDYNVPAHGHSPSANP